MERILVETMQSLGEYLPRMVNGCREITNNLQVGNEATALSQMPQFVEGLQWIFEAITGIQKNGLLHEIDFGSLQEYFNGVVNSLEIKDYVLLADLLEYEIAPVLEEWNTVISGVVI